jgi:hypothetical protein
MYSRDFLPRAAAVLHEETIACASSIVALDGNESMASVALFLYRDILEPGPPPYSPREALHVPPLVARDDAGRSVVGQGGERLGKRVGPLDCCKNNIVAGNFLVPRHPGLSARCVPGRGNSVSGSGVPEFSN